MPVTSSSGSPSSKSMEPQAPQALVKKNADPSVRFCSRTLHPLERNYITTVRKCLAVAWGIQALRPFLQGEILWFTLTTRRYGCSLKLSNHQVS